MKMISWNVNGLRAVMQKGFMDTFASLDADLFCLQETKLQEGQIALELPGYHQYWQKKKKKGYSGTAVFSRMDPISVSYGIGVDEFDHEGRVITLEFPDFFAVYPVSDLFALADPPQHIHPRKHQRSEAVLLLIRHEWLFGLRNKYLRLPLVAVPKHFLDIVLGHALTVLFKTQWTLSPGREERRILASMIDRIADLLHEAVKVLYIDRPVNTLPHIELEHILHGELTVLVSPPLRKAQAVTAGILYYIKPVLAA